MLSARKIAFAVAATGYSVIAWGGFWDSMMYSGAVRTEYSSGYGTGTNYVSLAYTDPATLSPLFGTDAGCRFSSTNPIASMFKCPGRAAVSTVWQGNLQAREYCGGNPTAIGDSYYGCLSYASNTYFSLNSPGSNYWVIHANHDPSFDQCRAGLPGASEFIVDPVANPTTQSLYKVAVETNGTGRKTMNIIVAPWEHTFSCNGNRVLTFPYLSVGAHSIRGNGGAIGTMYQGLTTGADTLNFKAQIRGHANLPPSGRASGCKNDPGDPCAVDPSAAGVHAGVLIVASWQNMRRMLFLDLYNEGSLATNYQGGPYGWSWPLSASMFWPGGEVAKLTANQISSCSLSPPMLSKGAPGTQNSYSLNMRSLFNCAASKGFFSSSMPTGQYVNVEAVDWFVEFGNATSGMLWLAIEDPYIS